MKTSAQKSVTIRNLQLGKLVANIDANCQPLCSMLCIILGLMSLPMTALPVLFENYEEHSLLQGYNHLTYAIIALQVSLDEFSVSYLNSLFSERILLQSLGGLLVAIVIKYADNILKGYATSISVIICSFVSRFYVENSESFNPGIIFFLGSTLVVGSSCLYSVSSLKKPDVTVKSISKA